jgi:hypothetical protein
MFKAPHPGMTNAANKAARAPITHAKSYADVEAFVGGPDALAHGGKAELDAIADVLAERERLRAQEEPGTAFEAVAEDTPAEDIAPEDAAIVERALGGLEPPQEAAPLTVEPPSTEVSRDEVDADVSVEGTTTPREPRPNPEAPGSRAPRLPGKALAAAALLERGKQTPTPGGGVDLPTFA